MDKLSVTCIFVILGVAFANYPGYELYSAARDGGIDFVKQAIAEGTDVNSKNPRSGATALMAASHRNQIEVVKFLLEAGAKVDEVDIAGHTALYFAASTGSAWVVPFLLDYGANVNAQTRSGTTPVIAATVGNHLNVLRMLIDRDADVNLAQNNGWAPLHFAARNNRMDIAKELLQAGADADAEVNIDDYDYGDSSGKTAIDIAIAEGHDQLAAFIEAYPRDNHFELLFKEVGMMLRITYATIKFVACILTS